MEERVAYSLPQPTNTVPRDLFNFWRRVLKLQRGRVYNVLLRVPEKQDQPVTWVFLGDGKEENGG